MVDNRMFLRELLSKIQLLFLVIILVIPSGARDLLMQAQCHNGDPSLRSG